MAYYNANLVVKLSREAMGITQEELCDGICHPVSLSRIENEHHIVKRDIYRSLMKKMGRMPEKHYAVCISKNGELLGDKIEVERAFKRYDYEAAEQHLQKMKELADDNILTRQYIVRREALVDYYLKRIEAEELAERLSKALQMTVPEYEKYLDTVFPFTKGELLMLMNLRNAYRKANKREKSLLLYKAVLRCLNAKYMGPPDVTTLQITVRDNLSIIYEKEGKNQEALAEINACLELATKIDYGHSLPTLLTAKAFNYLKLVEKKEMGSECLEEAKKISQQAYYIAAARGDTKVMETIEKFYNNKFGKKREV